MRSGFSPGDARVASHELTVGSDGQAAVLGLHRAVGVAQTRGGRGVGAVNLRKVEERRIRINRSPILLGSICPRNMLIVEPGVKKASPGGTTIFNVI